MNKSRAVRGTNLGSGGTPLPPDPLLNNPANLWNPHVLVQVCCWERIPLLRTTSFANNEPGVNRQQRVNSARKSNALTGKSCSAHKSNTPLSRRYLPRRSNRVRLNETFVLLINIFLEHGKAASLCQRYLVQTVKFVFTRVIRSGTRVHLSGKKHLYCTKQGNYARVMLLANMYECFICHGHSCSTICTIIFTNKV